MSEENWNNNEQNERNESVNNEPWTEQENADQGNETQDNVQEQENQSVQENPEEQVNTEEQVENEPVLQPLPSSDNMYRFQNVEINHKSKAKTGRKEKKSGNIKHIIVAAAIFGVVAGVCFFALVKITGIRIGDRNEIGTVDTTNTVGEVTAVSGGAAGPGDVSGIVDRVMPSIVAITETSTVSSYFGQTYPTQGAGSGFIVKEDNKELLIVTNNHVVQGADSITVTFIDDTTAKATVKGTDSTSDLAVLSVKESELKAETKEKIKVASLGHSDDVKVGQMAIAIGNALGYGQSVTVGYISAKDREVQVGEEGQSAKKMVLLQTDAAINPGNSGGALLDVNGNVIGINSVKYADTDVEGIGYAIPMSNAIPIINELMKREVLSDEEKGYLGITGRNIGEELSKAYGFPVGVYVSEVAESGAAKKAGIKQGDVITKINDIEVTSIEQVQNKVNNTKAGTKIKVTIERNQDGEYQEQDVEVTLKGSDTLDELSNDTQGQEQNNTGDDSSQFGYGDDSYGNNGQQILPW